MDKNSWNDNTKFGFLGNNLLTGFVGIILMILLCFLSLGEETRERLDSEIENLRANLYNVFFEQRINCEYLFGISAPETQNNQENADQSVSYFIFKLIVLGIYSR